MGTQNVYLRQSRKDTNRFTIHNSFIDNTTEPTLTVPILKLLQYWACLFCFFTALSPFWICFHQHHVAGKPQNLVFSISCCPAVAFAGLEMPFVQVLTSQGYPWSNNTYRKGCNLNSDTKIMVFFFLLHSVPMKTSWSGTYKWVTMKNCFTPFPIDGNFRSQNISLKKVNGDQNDQHAKNIEPKRVTQSGTNKQWIGSSMQYSIEWLHVLCQGNNCGKSTSQGATESAAVDIERLANCQSQLDSIRGICNSTFAGNIAILQFLLLKFGS